MLKTKKNGFLSASKLFGSPYSFKDNCVWLKRCLIGPSKNNKTNVDYLSKQSVLNNIKPMYTISFIGDIMDVDSKDLIIGERVKNFVKGSDFLIGNFEATLTEKNIINGKKHKPQIMDALAGLFDPNKTYLSTANNHSGDFGEESFSDSVNQLKSRGFNVFGTDETPFVDIANDLRIIGGTQWSNRPCDYLAKLEDSTHYLKPDSCNLLFPHWGYEMELYPRAETVKHGKELLNKFDALIGHHSHCPQPVSYLPIGNDNKLLAYSLGDFCDGKKVEMHSYGIIVKVEIGINAEGKWQVGQCEWTFLKTRSLSKTEFIIETVDNFSEFSFKYKTVQDCRVNEVYSDSWVETEQVVACT
ncbi:MAG: CapA family protein [Promethearchaeota archaeon]